MKTTNQLIEEAVKRLQNWTETQHETAGWEQKLENFLESELRTIASKSVEDINKIADELWKSPPWSPEWNDEVMKIDGYRRAMRDIQEALSQNEQL